MIQINLVAEAVGFAWAFDLLALTVHEATLFAAIWFFIGAVDDFAIDMLWVWHKIRKPKESDPVNTETAQGKTFPPMAIFVPAWREAGVIGHMIRHCRHRWAEDDFRLYLGSYINDPATYQAALRAAEGDPRIRLVVNEKAGPTSKADCLNRLWRAMNEDERESGQKMHAVMLHDAEDLVHPDALKVITPLIGHHDFVQLPVIAIPHPDSLWISGHYCDEFAEAHGKAMVVRNRLAVGLPAAGVGCAFSRDIMQRLADTAHHGHKDEPFAADSITEDYELGLHIHQMKGRGLFLRQRDEQGEWIGTRAYFPSSVTAAVRQKSRWMTGIALAGWDRMGWAGNFTEHWMRLRDRRSILAALVLTCAYFALLLISVLTIADWAGLFEPAPFSPLLILLLKINLVFLLWQLVMRYYFTAAQYGRRQGLIAIPRMFVSNIIAILAARRALGDYIASFFGRRLTWNKTDHAIVPFASSMLEPRENPAGNSLHG